VGMKYSVTHGVFSWKPVQGKKNPENVS